jgi:acyl-coenzyme A thioesterase PaaI-like protein
MQQSHPRQPIGGSKFVFGATPGGFKAAFFLNPDGAITGTVTIDGSKEGPPGHAHGGSLATLVDEAMGAACWRNGYHVLAANLNFDYRRPVPLNVEITVTGRVDRVDGRKIYTVGEVVLPDGMVAVQGRGLFIVAPEIFINSHFEPFAPPDPDA